MNLGQTVRNIFHKLDTLSQPKDILMMFLRVWIAQVFYVSGRTKAGDGYLELNDTAIFLFEEEYAVPFLSPEFAAQMALYGETIFPIMLIVGLGSRFAALGLLVMTAVIQFVYPNLFADHLIWFVVLMGILLAGPGKFSLDSWIHNATK
jgi:putative oxidoreductase